MALEGKVANILNDRELVINLGRNDGVTEGTEFEVLGLAQEVRDPDSGEILGEVEPSKVKLRVFEVQDRFAVARTFETYVVELDEPSAYPVSGTIVFGTRGPRRVTRVKKLLPPSTISSAEGYPRGYPRFTEEGAYVRVGDKVRQIYYHAEE